MNTKSKGGPDASLSQQNLSKFPQVPNKGGKLSNKSPFLHLWQMALVDSGFVIPKTMVL